VGAKSLLPNVQPLLHDTDINVRREAVRFYADFSDDSPSEMLGQWLNDEDSELRGAALYYLAENPKLGDKLLAPELIESFLREGKQSRFQVAEALGILNDESYKPYLMKLLQDTDSSIRIRAIKSAGQVRANDFVAILVQNLGDRTYRKTAREALAEYGDTIIDTLAEYLKDQSTAIEIRSGIPRVLSLIGSQCTVEVLLDNLAQDDETLRYQMIKALNKLRATFSNLNFDQRVDEALIDELKKYFRILAALHKTDLKNGLDGQSFDLLARVLQERLDDHIDRIFRLLGLCYPPRDIYNAYAATTSTNRSIRANAVEFLDNILSNNLKRILLPIVEELPVEQVLQRANGLLDVSFNNRKEALEDLAKNSDPWLRACALYEIGKCGLVKEFRPLINHAKAETNSLVQETANFVLRQFA